MDTLRVIPGLDLDMTDKLLALKTEKLTVPPEAVLSCLKDLHEEVGLEEDDVDDLCKLFSDACKELLSLHWLHKKSMKTPLCCLFRFTVPVLIAFQLPLIDSIQNSTIHLWVYLSVGHH